MQIVIMKKFILLASLLTTIKLGAQTSTFDIVSDIQNFDAETYSMTIWGRGKPESTGKIPVFNKQIRYQDTTSIPLVIRITPSTQRLIKRVRGGYLPAKSQSIWLIAMPGSQIRIVGELTDFSDAYPEGDKENEILTVLTKAYFPIINESLNIAIGLRQNEANLSQDELRLKKRKKEELDKKARKVLVSFLKDYPSSIAGLYFLHDTYARRGIEFEIVREILEDVDKSYQTNHFYAAIKTRVEASKYQVGNHILEIRSNRTPDSVLFSTTAWQGKFYLIDFWGSWCGPCISDFPNVKALKKDLNGKIEILGIASDQEKRWRSAIHSYQLDWQHILLGDGDEDFATLLDVRGYPTKILVDPKGRILYKGSGSGVESFFKIRHLIENWEE